MPWHVTRFHPTYRMLATPMEKLKARAQALLKAISESGAKLQATVAQSTAYLGSGTLPDQAIPSLVIKVSRPHLSAAAFSRKLRLDEACVFGRIEEETLCLDMLPAAPAVYPMAG